jgi:hypothetical protein
MENQSGHLPISSYLTHYSLLAVDGGAFRGGTTPSSLKVGAAQ